MARRAAGRGRGAGARVELEERENSPFFIGANFTGLDRRAMRGALLLIAPLNEARALDLDLVVLLGRQVGELASRVASVSVGKRGGLLIIGGDKNPEGLVLR